MKVFVINGSPKGDNSVTLQSVKYLKKCFTDDEFGVYGVAKKLYSLKKGDGIEELKKEIEKSDIILVSYPVYTFLAPSQLHAFFEAMEDNGIDFCGKYVTQFTTSKRFFDVTAHSAVKNAVAALKGRFIDGLSADMEDLLKKNGREELTEWWKYVGFCVENGICADFDSEEIPQSTKKYVSVKEQTEKSEDKRILVLSERGNDSLDAMVKDFCAVTPYVTDVMYVEDLGMKNGCLGCLKCTLFNHCAIKDGFEEKLNGTINRYDAIVTAFGVRLHTVGSEIKKFYDRQFVNGHRPVTADSPCGYIISGNIEKESALKQYLEAKSAVGGNPLCGIVCDADKDTEKEIENLSRKLCYALENGLKANTNFYGKGGTVIFRDMIFVMRGLMKEDYAYFKSHGFFDGMPHKQKGKIIGIKLLGLAARNKKINEKMPDMMTKGMLKMYEKYIK